MIRWMRYRKSMTVPKIPSTTRIQTIRSYTGLCDVSLQFTYKLKNLSVYEKQFPISITIPPAVRENLYDDIESSLLINTDLNAIVDPVVLTDTEIAVLTRPTSDTPIAIHKTKMAPSVLHKMGKLILEMEIHKDLLVSSHYNWDLMYLGKMSTVLEYDIIVKTLRQLGFHSQRRDKTVYRSFTILLLILKLKHGDTVVTTFIRDKYLPESYRVVSNEYI